MLSTSFRRTIIKLATGTWRGKIDETQKLFQVIWFCNVSRHKSVICKEKHVQGPAASSSLCFVLIGFFFLCSCVILRNFACGRNEQLLRLLFHIILVTITLHSRDNDLDDDGDDLHHQESVIRTPEIADSTAQVIIFTKLCCKSLITHAKIYNI